MKNTWKPKKDYWNKKAKSLLGKIYRITQTGDNDDLTDAEMKEWKKIINDKLYPNKKEQELLAHMYNILITGDNDDLDEEEVEYWETLID